METTSPFYHKFRKIYVEYLHSNSVDYFSTWVKENYGCDISIGETWETSFLTFPSEEDYFLFLMRF